MFCFQCQETAKNQGCTVKGVCGKPEETADLQDLLIYVCKGISVFGEALRDQGTIDRAAGHYICEALFTTISNVAWDDDMIINRIKQGLAIREDLKKKAGSAVPGTLPDCALWSAEKKEDFMAKALSDEVRITAAPSEDVRSLKRLNPVPLGALWSWPGATGVRSPGVISQRWPKICPKTRSF